MKHLKLQIDILTAPDLSSLAMSSYFGGGMFSKCDGNFMPKEYLLSEFSTMKHDAGREDELYCSLYSAWAGQHLYAQLVKVLPMLVKQTVVVQHVHVRHAPSMLHSTFFAGTWLSAGPVPSMHVLHMHVNTLIIFCLQLCNVGSCSNAVLSEILLTM